MLPSKKALLICSQYARKGTNTTPIRNLEKHCGDFEKLIKGAFNCIDSYEFFFLSFHVPEKFGYKSESTTVLLDSKRNMNKDRLAHLRPTRDNIVRNGFSLAFLWRKVENL